MNALSILGIGSPFGDDRVGWKVIELLRQDAQMTLEISEQRLRLEICDRPGTALLEHLQGVEKAWLIDAVITGAPVGTIHTFAESAIEQVVSATSTHNLQLSYTLQLGRTLNQLPSMLCLYGIEIAAPLVGDTHSIETPLSEPIAQAAQQLAIFLREQVKTLYELHAH